MVHKETCGILFVAVLAVRQLQMREKWDNKKKITEYFIIKNNLEELKVVTTKAPWELHGNVRAT